MSKRNLKSVITAVAMLAVSASAFGAGTTDGKISTINAGGGYVYVKGTMTGNPGACGSSAFYVLQTSTTDFKNVYAALLTSYATERTVALNVVGCVTPGATEFPNITSLILK